jgi:hypothetical protein
VKLCISGQRSGYSEGIYNSLHDAIISHEFIDDQSLVIRTVEHSVLPLAPDKDPFFSKPGDSGSLVYTKEGHVVVGLLFAGALDGDDPFPSYFTPINDLIEDIKEITKATEVRLLQE